VTPEATYSNINIEDSRTVGVPGTNVAPRNYPRSPRLQNGRKFCAKIMQPITKV